MAPHDKAYPSDSAEAILLSLPRPIAVVGNGRPARAFGALIDGYASVLRFNNYVTHGFEAQVGSRTTLRVTSGWTDIEVRRGVPEISPFHRHRAESGGLDNYARRGGAPIATPSTDHLPSRLKAVAKPSTGIALLALCDSLGIEVDAFGFDGFESGHYWSGQPIETTHASSEKAALLRLPCVTLMGPNYDYASLYDFCHSEHKDYDSNEGLTTVRQLGLKLSGERILEFGSGNGDLALHLQQQGNRVTAMDVSVVALARVPVSDKVQGDCLDLALLAGRNPGAFDRLVSFDVLEHLTENDIRIVLRSAAKACRSLLASVSTRPSGLTGPQGQNLHLTVKPVSWWLDEISKHFVVNSVVPGIATGQMLFEGYSRQHVPDAVETDQRLPLPPHASSFELPPAYVSRPVPDYFVDSVENCANVVWQPDVYPVTAELARMLRCSTVIDVGCGQARKLVAMPPHLNVIGIDYGPNIEFCRQHHRRGSWIEANFEVPLPLPIPRKMLADAVVVCSDVIEHMVDPMRLLAVLKHLMKHAAALVISTPDRPRTHGATHNGPPRNPAHTREWSLPELGQMLTKAGFTVANLSYTRSNDADPAEATVMAVLVNPNHANVGHFRSANPATQAVAAARPAPAEVTPETLLTSAQEQLAAGNIEAFEAALQRVLSLAPRHPAALRFLAGLQLNQGSASSAAEIYDSLIAEGHRDAEILEGVVLAHWRSGDVKSAAQRLLTHA